MLTYNRKFENFRRDPANLSLPLEQSLSSSVYQYDALHRIRKSIDYRFNGTAWAKATTDGNNNTEYTYDPNGNIKTLKRQANGILVDDFNYSYLVNGDGRLTTNNRLNNIKDNSLTTNDGYLNNGDHPFATDAYDAIGNITKNGGDGISKIEWNVHNKISKVISLKGTTTYTYDASGNRLTKAVKIGTQGDENTTVYVRDATGNVLSVYKKETTNAVYYQKEVYLYGSSRIGVHNFEPTERKLSDPAPIALQATRGKKFFELSNHLGNVLTTITDQKLWRTEGGNSFYVATVVNATDYHPFGLAIKSRTFGSDKYRFGFNGKENDESWGSELIQDYGFRVYSPSTGRFFSVDPLRRNYPFYSPYQFAGNMPIIAIDMDGAEPKTKYDEWSQVPGYKREENFYHAHNWSDAIYIEGFWVATRPKDIYGNKDFAWYDGKVWISGWNPNGYKDNGGFKTVQDIANNTSTAVKTIVAIQAVIMAAPLALEALPMLAAAGTEVSLMTNEATFAALNYGLQNAPTITGFLLASGGFGLAAADETAQLEGMGISAVIPKIGLPVIQKLCFVAGTLVFTNKGLIPIEQVTTRDSVLTYSEAKQINEWRAVSLTSKNQTKQLTRIVVQKDTIFATPSHRFFTDFGWIQAKNLNSKISIKLASGGFVKVNSVFTFDSTANVYNLEVDSNHNYFITKLLLVVHNGPCGDWIANLTNKSFEGIAKESNSLLGQIYKTTEDLNIYIQNIAKESGYGGKVFGNLVQKAEGMANELGLKKVNIEFQDVSSEILEQYRSQAARYGYKYSETQESEINKILGTFTVTWSK